MAGVNMIGTKGRVLFLRKYLEEHTGDSHVITTEDLIRLYKANSFSASSIPLIISSLLKSVLLRKSSSLPLT